MNSKDKSSIRKNTMCTTKCNTILHSFSTKTTYTNTIKKRKTKTIYKSIQTYKI